MGTFFKTIEIGAAHGGPFESVKVLIDTGATYTYIPSPVLERLGITPLERQPFVLADGRRIECEISQVRVRIDGRERYTICIFGDAGATPLLGAVTLEEFGLSVDPVKKQPVPVSGFLV
ncbi:MAG: clan AA aspartic protease [Chloroflexi bacterium]|nr:clan AA aspartic protease [Chloroflexota bacterium]